ncbi:MAG: UDP-2,3-diacylglucosamine diphosphatase LpxI [Kiritimatiellae bacterium]|nr:UDP-2,3-diacylglucosamine diphosphatase LpxI [Kiritimatiellia bacterium]
MTPRRIIVIAGAGSYPRLVVEGAKAAGVETVDVLALRGSTDRATVRAGDHVYFKGIGCALSGVRWVAENGYEGAILAGQVNPLSLFRTRFDADTRQLLSELPVKCAHTVYGRLVEEFEKLGVAILPASSYMDGHLPGAGTLTARAPDERELSDARHGAAVVRDMGRHDVGQTVLVKEGMVLAVEAFEGTNAAIRRGGKLGGRGAVLVKGAREGHDMRFDIPVVGLKTIKTMKKAGTTALAFQAGRLILLDRDEVIRFADRCGIAIFGMATDLPPAPTRP